MTLVHRWLLSTIIVLLAFGASAQNSTIAGTVTGTDSSTAIPGLSVYLENTTVGTATNSSGKYLIKNVRIGDHTLVVSGIGYLTIRKKFHIMARDTLTIDFTVVESISTLSAVTVTGGRAGIRHIPGSVSYLSQKELAKYSYTDINRTLRAVPGINMQEEDGFGLRPNIGLRGTGVERSSKITVMEDGVLSAPAPYAAPAAYYFPTIGRMQAVEILKGSSQIRYGPYTTGGAINLISTQIPEKFSGRIRLGAGSFGGRNLHAFMGNSHRYFAYLVETFIYGSNGFKKLDGGGNTGFDKKDYIAKLRVNTASGSRVYQSLMLKLGQTNETSNETYLGLAQEDFDVLPYRRYAASQKDQMNAKHFQVSMTHEARFKKVASITTTAYYSSFNRNWYKLDKVADSSESATSITDILENPHEFTNAFSVLTGDSSNGGESLFVKANNRSYSAQGVQTVLSVNFTAKSVKHQIDAGLRYHQDGMDRFQWIDKYAMNNGTMLLTEPGTAGTESNRIESAHAIAAYLLYKLQFGKLTATSGIRYEHIIMSRKDYGKNDPERIGSELSGRSNQVDVFIPGIGLDYRFSKNISAFAGIHRGFAPPGSKEGTRPEESINYETGVRYAKNSMSGELIGFFNDYHNLLGSDLAAAGGNGSSDMFNGGNVNTFGVEVKLSYDLLSSFPKSSFGLPFTVAYSYTDAKFKNGFESDNEGWGTVARGDNLPYLAKNQLAVMLTLEHRKFSIDISGKYMDAMRTVPGQGEIPSDYRIDAHFIIDASISYQLHKYVSLNFSTTNVMNSIYAVARRPAGLRPGMPRAFNLTIVSNF